MGRKVLKNICLIILGVIFFLGYNDRSFAVLDHELFANESGLIIQAQTDKMIYKLDQEVMITVYLKNKTDDVLEVLEPAIDSQSFEFEIINPEGKKDKLLSIDGVNLKTIRLYPKKRIKFTEKFLPEIPGNYDINIKYNGFKTAPLTAASIRIFVVGNSPLSKIGDTPAIE